MLVVLIGIYGGRRKMIKIPANKDRELEVDNTAKSPNKNKANENNENMSKAQLHRQQKNRENKEKADK